MNSGIYTAYSGMKAQADALDILANNLANANTTGFKEQKAFYTYLNQSAENAQGEGNLNSIINRSVQTRSMMNFETGSLNETNRELDVAIAGDGFLAVQTPYGVRYTRNGNLNLNSQSMLTTSEGHPVLGASGRTITLGPGKIQIGESGDVLMDGVQVDRLKVTSFTDLSALEKEGSSLFKSSGGPDSEKASDAKIKSGFLEESNVNPVASIIRMVEIQRNFETMQKSINLVMNEVNSKAIDKLGR